VKLVLESRVILFSYDPNMERVCAASMRSCYSAYPSYDLYSYSDESAREFEGERPLDDQRVKSLLSKALELEHLDVLEHAQLTFDLQHISRACTHQLVRHRLASFSQQSQRYLKITRSRGYVTPPSIGNNVRVPVKVRGVELEMTFEDMMDVATQVEEGLLRMGIRAEDARYVRPNAAATNIVTSMNPRQLLHVISMRCAPDAQWEIRDIAWAMFACAKLVAPNIFETIPTAKDSRYTQEKIAKLDALVKEARTVLEKASRGDLIEIPLSQIGLEHAVRAFARKL
jgi:thymidylate synthase (FAD)